MAVTPKNTVYNKSKGDSKSNFKKEIPVKLAAKIKSKNLLRLETLGGKHQPVAVAGKKRGLEAGRSWRCKEC